MAKDAWESPAGRRVKAACFERDKRRNAPCMWCGNPIDYGKGPYRRGGDILAWAPEHIRPQDRWPELVLEPSNIGPAHFHCNASRQDRAGLAVMGVRSRRW